MRILPVEFIHFLRHRASRENVELLLHLVFVLIGIIVISSSLFLLFMSWEGKHYDWITAVYWTVSVMTTLGFGDIVFESTPGRILTIAVVSSGLLFLLVLLPFTIVRFVQSEARVPRRIPGEWKGHVILTHYDAVTYKLIKKLERFRHPYVLLVQELQKALQLFDQGVSVVLGDLDTLDTYRSVLIHRAALVVSTATDEVNSNVVNTVRELSEQVPIIATAKDAESVDILQLAGSSYVLQLDRTMGEYLARRTQGGDAAAHVFGQIGDLMIAEAMAAGTPLPGQSLQESRLRETVGINVIGFWERGRFRIARPEATIQPGTVLVLAGSENQIRKYNEMFGAFQNSHQPVIIIGGGRVGRATGAALQQRHMDYVIIEKMPERILPDPRYIPGSAAERRILEQAGIMEAPAVIITTHDDDTNIYLTTYCRHLRPDIQIISRATRERNVPTLHRAGADFCMSYASMGANIVFNRLKRGDIVMVAEGLDLFQVKVPPALAGMSIAQSNIRQKTGCSIVRVVTAHHAEINPDPETILADGADLILIGSVEAEEKFTKLYLGRAIKEPFRISELAEPAMEPDREPTP